VRDPVLFPSGHYKSKPDLPRPLLPHHPLIRLPDVPGRQRAQSGRHGFIIQIIRFQRVVQNLKIGLADLCLRIFGKIDVRGKTDGDKHSDHDQSNNNFYKSKTFSLHCFTPFL
jgi:hypothetical protein